MKTTIQSLNTISKLYDAIKQSLLDFDADEEFDELWAPSSRFSAREFLRILDKDEEHFKEAAAHM